MAATTTTAIGKGLADPVLETQVSFRSILRAMTRPGDVARLEATAELPDELPAAAAIAVLTLCDHETPLWLPQDQQGSWGGWATFHTGARLTSDCKQAAFAIVPAGENMLMPTAFATGDDRYPDRSTTVIVPCTALTGGRPLVLTGPGIETSATLSPRDLPDAFWSDMLENHALYPCGIDLMLAAGDAIVCLPRSTRISYMEAG